MYLNILWYSCSIWFHWFHWQTRLGMQFGMYSCLEHLQKLGPSNETHIHKAHISIYIYTRISKYCSILLFFYTVSTQAAVILVLKHELKHTRTISLPTLWVLPDRPWAVQCAVDAHTSASSVMMKSMATVREREREQVFCLVLNMRSYPLNKNKCWIIMDHTGPSNQDHATGSFANVGWSKKWWSSEFNPSSGQPKLSWSSLQFNQQICTECIHTRWCCSKRFGTLNQAGAIWLGRHTMHVPSERPREDRQLPWSLGQLRRKMNEDTL